MSPEFPYLDRHAIDELAEAVGDQEMVAELLQLFLTDTAPIMVSILEQQVSRDYVAISRAAHRMKSGAAYVGATLFSRTCAELELLAREGVDPDAICGKITLLQSVWERTAVEVKRHLEMRGNS